MTTPAPAAATRAATTDDGPAIARVKFSMLAIDDCPSDLDLLRRLVRKVPEWEVALSTSTDPIEGLATVDARRFDLVLVDYRIGAINGVELLHRMRARGFKDAVIVLTGQGDERVAADALRAGAADYIPKQDLNVSSLHRSVSNALERSRLQREVTEHRVRLERANQDLERRNSEVQSFYHTLSHELKTPLTSAREFVSILMEGLAGPITATQREYLGYVKDGCDQLTVCLNDLLDVSRIETGRLSLHAKPADLRVLVRKVVSGVAGRARAAEIELEERVAPELPCVEVDPHRITQVLSNLVDNALKFTPSLGRVEVSARIDASDPNFVRVEVSDTGKGISPAHLPNIFERRYQVKDGSEQSRMGLGLGLFICREIVRLHGGDIAAESDVGKGTTVAFTVPVLRKNPSNATGGK